MYSQYQSLLDSRDNSQYDSKRLPNYAPKEPGVDDEQSAASPVQVLDDDVTLDVLINQIGFVRTLSACTDIEDLGHSLSEVLAQLGFSDFAFMRMAACHTFDASISSLSEDWLQRYRGELFYRDDMVLDYVKTGSSNPVYHSEVAQIIDSAPLLTHNFKRNLQIRALYQEFGFQDTYFIPVQTNRGKGEDLVLFAVMNKDMAQDDFVVQTESCKPVLRLLADAVNFICDTKFSKSKPKPVVNPRPMRLLTLMAKRDLSLSEAASELCISVDTANKHMAMAKRALQTRSQANAVYLAVKQGLIDFN